METPRTSRFGLTIAAIYPRMPRLEESRGLELASFPRVNLAETTFRGSDGILPECISGTGWGPCHEGLCSMRKALFGLIPLAAVALAGWLIVLDRQGWLVWDHWDEVKRGVLYRSGQLTGSQLTQAVQRHHIRTVVNLQLPSSETLAERALVATLGVDFVNLPMPGDGFGEEAQFREILKILDDPERCPVLVHCARGTCRTGAAVAMYRFERDGWTIDDVAVEMRRQTYRYGWLPGYMYAMSKNRPSRSGPRPVMLDDRNRAVETVAKEAAHEP